MSAPPPGSGEVVITGLGTLGAFGCGREELACALAAAVPLGATEIDRSAGYHREGGARRALLTRLGGPSPWLPPAEARRMSPPSRQAVIAARLALADAGLPWRGGAAAAAGSPVAAGSVVLATAFGPCSFSEALLRQVLLEEPEAASPFLFTESVANAPAAQVAIASGARGPNVTVCQREAGALIAVGQAAGLVAAGGAGCALAGAVDEVSPLMHSLLDRFGALARGHGGEEVARPFDRRRAGFLAADGSTVVVLESADAACRRGVAPLARLLAWGSAFDPSAGPAGWGSGAARLGRGLLRTLERGRLEPGAIDCIVSGASGSRGGDRLEALTLRAAWEGSGRPLPVVLAPKSVVGEYGGGFLAAAVLAGAGAAFGPTLGFAEPDPELGIVPHDGRPLAPPRAVLASALAVGGAAAWLVLAPWRPGERPAPGDSTRIRPHA